MPLIYLGTFFNAYFPFSVSRQSVLGSRPAKHAQHVDETRNIAVPDRPNFTETEGAEERGGGREGGGFSCSPPWVAVSGLLGASPRASRSA